MYVNEHDTYSHGLSQFGSFKQKQNQFVESHMVSLWSAIKLNNRFTATDTTATAKKNVNSHFSLLNCICSEGFKFLFLCLLFSPKVAKVLWNQIMLLMCPSQLSTNGCYWMSIKSKRKDQSEIRLSVSNP